MRKMSKTEVKAEILKTLKEAAGHDVPDLKSIRNCINLIVENDLEEGLKEGLETLKMIHTLGSFMSEEPKKPSTSFNPLIDHLKSLKADAEAAQKESDEDKCNECDEDGEDGESSLTFTLTKKKDGNMSVSLAISNFSTLEVAGSIELLRQKIEEAMDERKVN